MAYYQTSAPGRAVEHDQRLHLTLFFFLLFFSFLQAGGGGGEGGHRKSGLFKRLSAHTHNPATRTYVKMPLTKPPERKKKKKRKKRERCCSFEQIYRTMGLISADRSNKATLLLTIPRSIKVVCNGFISSNI
ncbi:hypothetical protein K457DRAFT_1887526 [Linnemannia elongata AG-77]|uniref:Uncharacterized protein n=1 Tax=Linnemannia elongata AG-77 TaxID=1314771 RepID=A0A197JCU9_9FUNG|nr:hypothetical protein K457DRAFT_1887526 [Linnemannia elongata AG-77]